MRRPRQGPRIKPSTSLFPRSQTENLSTRWYRPGRMSTVTRRSAQAAAVGRPHRPGRSTLWTPEPSLTACQGPTVTVLSYNRVVIVVHSILTTDPPWTQRIAGRDPFTDTAHVTVIVTARPAVIVTARAYMFKSLCVPSDQESRDLTHVTNPACAPAPPAPSGSLRPETTIRPSTRRSGRRPLSPPPPPGRRGTSAPRRRTPRHCKASKTSVLKSGIQASRAAKGFSKLPC